MATKKSSVSFDDIDEVVVKPKAAKKVATPAAPAVKRGFPAKKKLAAGEEATVRAPRPPPLRFAAPSDFKPFFAQIDFRTGDDGLITSEGFEVIRFRGRWDNEAARRYNMTEYDVPTVIAIASRLSAATFVSNITRRLPANTGWSLIARASKRGFDGSIIFSIKLGKVTKIGDAGGKLRWYKDVKDVNYRKIRRVNRILPSALVNVQLPPAGRQKKTADEE